MGKRPKRLVYALEGLGACPTACDSTAENIQQPSPIGLSHIAALNRAIQAIKAELLLDTVALHTFTASFQQADEVSLTMATILMSEQLIRRALYIRSSIRSFAT